MSRGEVGFFFWHRRETKGLGSGYKEEKLGPGCRLHFPPLARVPRWSGGNHVSVSWKSGNHKKGTKKSKGPISLEFPLLSFHLSSALCCYLLYFSLNIYSLGPKYS